MNLQSESVIHLLKKNDNFLIFDGAMGTMLQSKGLIAGELPESYNITHPEVILDIHKEYVAAGSHVITTNTFQANAYKMKNSPYSPEQIIKAAVSLAKKSGAKYVALDVGPTGQLLSPLGTLSFENAYELYKEQMLAGVEAGADIVLIETISDIYEAKAAILAAKENSHLPIFCTLTFQEDGRTFVGCDPKTVILTLQALGVDAVGLNCSLGPKEIASLTNEFIRFAKVPVIIQPNAGLPQIEHGCTVYNTTPAEFSHYMKELASSGVRIFGGCCGTTPAFISKMVSELENIKPISTTPLLVTAATSGTKTVCIGEGVTLIGERINPTGKKKLKEALRSQNFSYIIGEAIDQVNAGADILGINTGLPEIDEPTMLQRAVKEVGAVVSTPLQIDSADPIALEQAARIYNGRPIINSVNGTLDSMNTIFPIVKKYGCLVVGLTLDEDGIPETAEKRYAIAEKIITIALSYGISKEDILIDSLVLTASSNQEQVMTTLETLRLVKKGLKVKTLLGVSNVSFGMPNRSLLNSVFLAAALGAGLDAPILNPLSPEIMSTVHAFKVINAQDTDGQSFIKQYSKKAESSNPALGQSDTIDKKNLLDIIIEGRKDESSIIVEELLQTMDSLSIIDKYFIPALDSVGSRYEKGEIFLPQLIRSAETVKNAFVILKENMDQASPIIKGKILLATVKGDVHDIGKNIVKVLLENYGFEIIDLGKDVEIEDIVKVTKEQNIQLVGLSALMTTTIKNMGDTISALRKNDISVKIMVGGAVLNPEYAKLVGADFYAKDACDGIAIANKVFNVASPLSTY